MCKASLNTMSNRKRQVLDVYEVFGYAEVHEWLFRMFETLGDIRPV